MVLITQSGKDTLKVGSSAPDFWGPRGTDGKKYGLKSFRESKAVVISFTCNHCPYAQAYEDRFIALAHAFMPQGVAFVAINSNDHTHYPQDSFENMKIRAKEKSFPFPYVQDESQKVAKAYGAVCTPHIFVLDEHRKLVYEGRIDDNWKEPDRVTSPDLRNALEALLTGVPVPVSNTNPMGCSLKWKNQSFTTLIHKRS